MKRLLKGLLFALLLHSSLWTVLFAQAENVPVYHPVYIFLKRMEVRGIIEKYHDAVLPLGRKEVGRFLVEIKSSSSKLTDAEHGFLEKYMREFQFDITGSLEGFHSLINSEFPVESDGPGQVFADREKFLYALSDSNLSFFANGLLTVDGRGVFGDALGNRNTEFVQFGGRFRGTILNHLGFSLQGTNAQFWGSREVLFRDPVISQSFALGTTNAHNFDFVEGYARYDAGIVTAQVGRERVLWGAGYDQKMIASENVRVYDFIRADAKYKSLKYTFLHAWILGRRDNLLFTLPNDPGSTYVEPVVADKYFAAHRIELSLRRLFDVGFQEMAIYSNRAPDLAYLNPITLIESAQRSREERDNVLWAFDMQTRFLDDLEFSGTFVLDDFNIPDLGTDIWSNRFSYQAGMYYANPFSIRNANLMLEYTRVEPFVYSHNRSRENDYGSLGMPLGPRIGANADSWFMRFELLPSRNLIMQMSVWIERQGRNEVDSLGRLVRNVGSDILQPHRDIDPLYKKFLDGILFKTTRVQFFASFEFVRQLWLEGMFEFESVRNVTQGTETQNKTVMGRLRVEL
jgi:hypothetical protein